MNDFFLSVSEHLPRLDEHDDIFTVNEELPDAYCISVDETLLALQRVKTNKATGPDNIPAWVLKDHANILAAPLTAIFNPIDPTRFSNKLPCSPDHPAKMGKIWVPPVC